VSAVKTNIHREETYHRDPTIMAGTSRKSHILTNPFYVLLLIASTLFVVTALGYLVAPSVLDQMPAAGPGRVPQNASSKAFAAWLDRNAPLALGVEFVIMLVAAILAMLTDNWFAGVRKTPPAG
jgi:hypothetical protein